MQCEINLWFTGESDVQRAESTETTPTQSPAPTGEEAELIEQLRRVCLKKILHDPLLAIISHLSRFIITSTKLCCLTATVCHCVIYFL